MTEFLIANMAPLMFAALVVFLLLGYPVAFSLAANGLLFGIIAIELGLLEPQLLQALPDLMDMLVLQSFIGLYVVCTPAKMRSGRKTLPGPGRSGNTGCIYVI